ncbi:MAG: hypothetical protein EOL95_07200 [Bacteroidia bacterium]|nr:hypothetical protein [Bacteroidia bacterium]
MAIPLIILGSAAIAAMVVWLGKEKDDTFISTNVKQNYLRTDTDFSSPTQLLRYVTRTINAYIIPKCQHFKIGKSRNVENRILAHRTFKYKEMYLLVRSKNKVTIEQLEAHYNIYYSKHPKNDNLRGGSAGVCSDKDKYYYLYVITR